MKLINKIRPIIEIITFHFGVYLIFYYMSSNPESFFYLNPHPLLIGVIGFSLFYGNRFGILATGGAVIMYGVLFYIRYDEWMPLINQAEYFKLPLSFLWIGTTIGLVVDNHKMRQINLKDNLDLQTKEYTRINKQYQRSQEALSQLRSQIIDSDESIIALYDIAKRLQELDEDEILTETVGIISKYLEASQVMVYHYSKDYEYIRFLLGVGIPEDFSDYSINIEEKKYYKQVLEERQVLRYSDGDDKEHPLLVGPLIKNNEVIGLVVIREMNFDFISNYAYTLFRIILDWVNQSLNNVMLVEQQGERYIEDTKILTFDRFKKRLLAERRRYKEYGLKYVLFAVEAPDKALLYAIKIQDHIRKIDKVTIKDNTIYILLPATDAKKYPDIKKKIFSRLKFNLPRIKIGDEFK